MLVYRLDIVLMEQRLIVFTVVALERGVGVVFCYTLGAVFRKAELALGILSVPLIKPFIKLIARAHVPAEVMVIAENVSDMIERRGHRAHTQLSAGGVSRRVKISRELVHALEEGYESLAHASAYCYFIFDAPAEN